MIRWEGPEPREPQQPPATMTDAELMKLLGLATARVARDTVYVLIALAVVFGLVGILTSGHGA